MITWLQSSKENSGPIRNAMPFSSQLGKRHIFDTDGIGQLASGHWCQCDSVGGEGRSTWPGWGSGRGRRLSKEPLRWQTPGLTLGWLLLLGGWRGVEGRCKPCQSKSDFAERSCIPNGKTVGLPSPRFSQMALLQPHVGGAAGCIGQAMSTTAPSPFLIFFTD